jgi:hypothetical protein
VKEQKRQQQRLQEARARIAAKLVKKREERAARKTAPPPRYDDVYYEGVAWLDRLAGDALDSSSGEVTFDDEVWKSPMRGDRRG